MNETINQLFLNERPILVQLCSNGSAEALVGNMAPLDWWKLKYQGIFNSFLTKILLYGKIIVMRALPEILF